MPVDWHDHDPRPDMSDEVERLKAVHDLFNSVQGWDTAPPGSSRKLAYDKLAVLHEQAISRFANS